MMSKYWIDQLRASPLLAFICMFSLPESANAHGGGLNASGCHNDRIHGGYHCHGGGSQPPPGQVSRQGRSTPRGTYYANCSAARAAGAAPIRAGDPGYARHLDRDGDGIACE